MTKAGRVLALALTLGAAACASPPYMPVRMGPQAPPARPTDGGGTATDVVHTVGSFDGARGVHLYEQAWLPPTPPRGVVVVVHGLKDYGGRYAAFGERLAARGFGVYALDLRGHGRSEGVRVDIESFDDYLDDVQIFVDRVRQRNPGAKTFLFGHSMGGAIASLFTIARKPDLAGLILSGAALDVNVSAVTILGTKLVAGLSPKAGVFQLDARDFSRDPAVVKAGLEDPLVYQPGAPARTAKYLLGAIETIKERMGEITVPLLILHGTADKVTPPAGSVALNARASSRDKTLKLYDGLYHDLLHEPEKETVTRDIGDWLEARAPKP